MRPGHGEALTLARARRPPPPGPDRAFVPRALLSYSPPAQCMHRSVRGCGGVQVDGGSLARTRVGGRDGFVSRERSLIHWGNVLRRRFAQLVWRMRAANVSPAAGCARVCEGCWRFRKWEDANERRAAPAVSPRGVQCVAEKTRETSDVRSQGKSSAPITVSHSHNNAAQNDQPLRRRVLGVLFRGSGN